MPEQTAPLSVRSTERGIVRVFAMNMPAEQAIFQNDPAALEQILGVSDIDPSYVEIFPLSDLDQLGLVGYLRVGCGIPVDIIALDQVRLNALTGYVMLVFSRAFGGRAVTMHLAQTLTLVAAYSEPSTDWSGGRIETQSAKLYSSKRESPRYAPSASRSYNAMVFTILVLIVAATVLMVI